MASRTTIYREPRPTEADVELFDRLMDAIGTEGAVVRTGFRWEGLNEMSYGIPLAREAFTSIIEHNLGENELTADYDLANDHRQVTRLTYALEQIEMRRNFR